MKLRKYFIPYSSSRSANTLGRYNVKGVFWNEPRRVFKI
jgi:hypothetical protein